MRPKIKSKHRESKNKATFPVPAIIIITTTTTTMSCVLETFTTKLKHPLLHTIHFCNRNSKFCFQTRENEQKNTKIKCNCKNCSIIAISFVSCFFFPQSAHFYMVPFTQALTHTYMESYPHFNIYTYVCLKTVTQKLRQDNNKAATKRKKESVTEYLVLM